MTLDNVMLAATRSAEYVLLKETVPEKPQFLEVTSPKIHEDAVGLGCFQKVSVASRRSSTLKPLTSPISGLVDRSSHAFPVWVVLPWKCS